MKYRIERVDTIPLIIASLMKMKTQEIIDSIFIPHTNWSGLSYGQLAVLFVTYVLDSFTHRLSGMESWLNLHKTVIELTTGWEINLKDATDDRLGKMMSAFGKEDDKSCQFQLESGRRNISAYGFPTDVGRYDTTSFNVFHQPDDSQKGLLNFGHSKNHRPDLLQFKQGLGVLDPAGIPLITETLPGNRADDRCYTPAWRRMAEIISSPDFLFIADCKAASLETRATIDHELGRYLFPLPMTGNTPEILKELVLNLPEKVQDIILEPRAGQKDKKRKVGVGFEVNQTIQATLANQKIHEWQERWQITKSDAHAARRIKAFNERLAKADLKLKALKPKKVESAEVFLVRARRILKNMKLQDYLRLEVNDSVETKKKYKGRGRPGPNTPFEIIEIHKLSLSATHDSDAIERHRLLAGWRIYVTNTPVDRMTLCQSSQYYRDEYLVERGFHRFKKGSIPALPLFIRIPERIKGLMLLLTVALQVLTSIEFVARKELEKSDESISGLVPGNPKMKTDRPTAERMLSQFDNIHLLIWSDGQKVIGSVVENLKPLQKRILSILKLPQKIYDLDFEDQKIMNST